MEVFLLLLDELDDVAGVIRHVWRRVMGLLLALALFCATGWLLLHQPLLSAVGVAAVLSFALLERVRRRLLEARTKNSVIRSS
jgi:hypothetical protein